MCATSRGERSGSSSPSQHVWRAGGGWLHDSAQPCLPTCYCLLLRGPHDSVQPCLPTCYCLALVTYTLQVAPGQWPSVLLTHPAPYLLTHPAQQPTCSPTLPSNLSSSLVRPIATLCGLPPPPPRRPIATLCDLERYICQQEEVRPMMWSCVHAWWGVGCCCAVVMCTCLVGCGVLLCCALCVVKCIVWRGLSVGRMWPACYCLPATAFR